MNKYCPIPFFSLDINSATTSKLCCISNDRHSIEEQNILSYWHSAKMNKVRTNMLNGTGEEHDCSSCFYKEKEIGVSKRLDEIKKNPHFRKPLSFPSHLQLKINNVCNLKCIMCSPQYSSKWNEDVDKFVSMRPGLVSTTFEEIDKNYLKKILFLFIHNKTIMPKQLELYGGEPMLAKDFWHLVQGFDMKILRNIIFRANINGTILTEEQIKTLWKFEKNILNISVDGIEDVFEFVRYPAKWNVVNKNINRLREEKKKKPSKFVLNMFFTLSSFSAVGLNDFLDYCNDNQLEYYINVADTEPTPTPKNENEKIIFNEKGFSHPAMLPDKVKEIILTSIKSKVNRQNFHTIEKSLYYKNIVKEKKENFSQYCNLINQHRHKNFAEILYQKYNMKL